jgi:hypothetical protein
MSKKILTLNRQCGIKKCGINGYFAELLEKIMWIRKRENHIISLLKNL